MGAISSLKPMCLLGQPKTQLSVLMPGHGCCFANIKQWWPVPCGYPVMAHSLNQSARDMSGTPQGMSHDHSVQKWHFGKHPHALSSSQDPQAVLMGFPSRSLLTRHGPFIYLGSLLSHSLSLVLLGLHHLKSQSLRQICKTFGEVRAVDDGVWET